MACHWLSWINLMLLVALVTVNALGIYVYQPMVLANSSRIEALEKDQHGGLLKRADMMDWCLRLEDDNPGVVCPEFAVE